MRKNKKRVAAFGMCFALAVNVLAGGVNGTILQVQASEVVTPDVTPAAEGNMAIDEKNFPDKYFRMYVAGELEGYEDVSIDVDDDGILSAEERASVNSISISGEPVKDLTGIACFPNLSYLSVQEALVTTVDLSHNTNLQSVSLYYNTRLEDINLTGCSSLRDLNVDSCAVSKLDLGGCTQLNSLSCSNNQLSELNLEALAELTSLSCYGNELNSLDLSANMKLQFLNCESNRLASLDVAGLSELRNLYGYNNQLTELDLWDCSQLVNLSVGNNQLVSLDLAACSQLTDISVQNNKLTELNLKSQPELTYLYCHGNKLNSLDLSANTKLQNLSCGNNKLNSLDVSGLPELRELSCYNNQITDLDVTGSPRLTSIYCRNNQLRKLDISQNTMLRNLDINDNYITSLDASANMRLKGNYEGSGVCWYTSEIRSAVKELEDGTWLLDLSGQEGFEPDKLKVVEWYDDSNFPEITEQGVVWKENLVKKDVWLALDYDLSNDSYLDGQTLRCNYYLQKNGVIYDTAEVALTEENFPDENFREYLKKAYDYDDDGKFQPGTIDWLGIDSMQIKDLTGIQYFTSLTTLQCSNNQLTTLDVSKNPGLVELYCYNNCIMQFDFSNNTALEYVNIGGQRLELEVKKEADGRYTAESEVLQGIIEEAEIEKAGVLYNAKKTANGFRWESAPLDGRYSVTEIITVPCAVPNESYKGEKKYYIELILCNAYDGFDDTEVTIDEEHFPDAAFREYLKQRYDWDNDGKFQPGLVSDMDISGILELEDLTGIEYFSSLTYLYLNKTGICCLDLRNNPKIRSLCIYDSKVLSVYLAEDCMTSSRINSSPITATAVEENGRYVLDLSEYGGLDRNRIVELSDGELDGDKIYWNSESDVPLNFSYKFLLRSDYEEGMEYSEFDVLNVSFVMTNNAPEMPEGEIIELTKENFPSPQLLEYLKECYDYDNDGWLNTRDVTGVSLGKSGIASLDGIEHLNCLTNLSVWGGAFNKLDLSENTVLSYVYISGALTDIVLTGCPYLETLELSNNSLTQLDISKNRGLRNLYLGGNSLTELELSKNTNLQCLNVDNNALKSLDLSNNKKLQALNCSYNPKMTALELPAQKAGIKEIHVCGCSISSLPLSDMPNLRSLGIDNNQGNLSKVDLTNNTKLEYLSCYNIAPKVDWTKMTALVSLNINDSEPTLNKLDLSNLANLESCSIGMNSLTSLDVHDCTKLRNLYLNWGGHLQQLNLAGCVSLTELSCSNNELTLLDVSGCNSLKYLNCSSNQLETLDITGNPALQSLYCVDNKLTVIDTSQNPALKWFECSNNPIVSLDLSNNKAMLTDLSCMDASLTSLNVGENEALENVQLYGQIFKASAEDLRQEEETEAGPELYSAFLLKADALSPAENPLSVFTESRGAAEDGRYILYLDKYGDFDPGRVKDLSSGTAIENGIIWESREQIPVEVTYVYDISNEYKLSGRTMSVTIQLEKALTGAGITIPENPGTNDVGVFKKKLGSCKMALTCSSFTYSGKKIEPKIKVLDGKYVLVPGVDYTVIYKNNINVGKGIITFVGKGRYVGTVSKAFKINKASQKLSCSQIYNKAYGDKDFSLKVKRMLGNGKLTYTSSNQKVAKVDAKGKVTLKKTGVAIITIKAAATKNYEGQKVKVTVIVNPAKQKITSAKLENGTKLSVSWTKDKSATGYKVQCSTDKNFKKNVQNISINKNKTTSAVFKNLKKGQKYYVRVCSYNKEKGRMLSGEWSKAISRKK